MKNENLIFKLIEMLVNAGDGHDEELAASGPDYSDHPLIGENVIVRCRDAGVHAGKLISINGRTVIIKNSRRMYRWWSASEMTLSGVARCGINQSKSKITGELSKPLTLTDSCEVIAFENEAAEESVFSAEVYNEQ